MYCNAVKKLKYLESGFRAIFETTATSARFDPLDCGTGGSPVFMFLIASFYPIRYGTSNWRLQAV